MDLAVARTHVLAALTRMNAAYGQPVFDEWAILGLGGNGGVHVYVGPRPHRFRKELPDDAAPLRAEAAAQPSGVGDIGFAPAAGGTRYDAVCGGARRVTAGVTTRPARGRRRGRLRARFRKTSAPAAA